MPSSSKTPVPQSALPGLSQTDAAQRFHLDGPNELPGSRRSTVQSLVLDVIREPMLLLLVAAGSVYVLLGERLEAALLFTSIFVVVGIELYQEVRTERALESLRDLASPRALVIRDGIFQRIPGREVVMGDLMVLESGDRVPADARVIQSTNLSVDESLLTGESLPVPKAADRHDGVFSGTLVASGQGLAQVQATGSRTELGKIGAALEGLEVQRTSLQREIDGTVRIVGRIALVVCGLVALGYGLSQANWIAGLLAGISVAMSMIPEEFPIVLTAFLALGAARIARNQVLTRRVPAIEALGATTVLCTDKTGTLTLNRLAVARVVMGDEILDVSTRPLPETAHDFIDHAALASRPTATDPVDRAIQDLHLELSSTALEDTSALELVHEYSLSDALAAMTNVWRQPASPDLTLATKGSPEAIGRLCRLPGAERSALEQRVESLARAGFRVLAVAEGVWPSDLELPERQEDLPLQLVGLLGFADPIRPEVPAAIQECLRAGIRVVMITGDHRETAQQIARQIGLQEAGATMTGAELAQLDPAALSQRVETTSVFVRVAPEQKLRIVEALKSRGEVVAMTGDGVNDAPALKAADIGIAMGGRGTDVAREAAPLVLLDDNFASIVRAVRAGRRIYSNLQKSMTFLLSVHVPIAGLSLLPALAGWPLILLPAHIVLLELVVDPVCSLVFEREPDEEDIMERPPRDPSAPLFTRMLVSSALTQGTVVLVVTMAIHTWSSLVGTTEHARAMSFGTLVLGILGIILNNRSFSEPIYRSLTRPNRLMVGTMIGVPLTLIATVTIPQIAALFRFATLDAASLGLMAAAGLSSWVLLELVERAASRVQATLVRAA